jgi:hypothetical protein
LAIARPMPRVPPVTMAFLPFSPRSMVSSPDTWLRMRNMLQGPFQLGGPLFVFFLLRISYGVQWVYENGVRVSRKWCCWNYEAGELYPVSGAGISAATPNDLILAVKAESEQFLTTVLGKIDQWLSPDTGRAGKSTIRTLDEAMARQPHSNLAVISVPGAYAAREAQKALECGLNVFLFSDNSQFQALIPKERAPMKPEQKYLRGIFAGGTFCYQAQQVLQEAGLVVYSNAPLEGNPKLPNPLRSQEHTLVDMGADEFTAGRPHPMVDSRLRRERLLAEAQDPQVAILLLDFILGFNSSPDPVGELAPAIAKAKREAQKRGGFLSVVTSVCGTDEDPQDLRQQVRRLEGEGAVVFSSSAKAAQFCTLMVARPREESDVQ